MGGQTACGRAAGGRPAEEAHADTVRTAATNTAQTYDEGNKDQIKIADDILAATIKESYKVKDDRVLKANKDRDAEKNNQLDMNDEVWLFIRFQSEEYERRLGRRDGAMGNRQQARGNRQ